jgi:hypothetical protein
MNPLPSPPSRGDGRLSWRTLAALAGLLLIGVLSVINSVELARLSVAAPADVQDARLQVLAAQVVELAWQVEASRKRPEAVPLARYDAEWQSIEQRLAAVEQALNERPGDDGQLLRDRLSQLEERLTHDTAAPSANPPATPPPAPPNPSSRPKIAEPPFRVIGVERRAEERFLTLLPAKAAALSQARLLRVGDTEDGWRLDAIEEDAGVFSRGGKKHRLNLAGGKK